MAVTTLLGAAEEAAFLGSEEGGEEEEEEEAAAAGRGRVAGREVGLDEGELGERLNAVASLPGKVPKILIFDVFPRWVMGGGGKDGGRGKKENVKE